MELITQEKKKAQPTDSFWGIKCTIMILKKYRQYGFLE